MKKIAITGPIGSGKSFVCELFNEHFGIPIFYSDFEAKWLYQSDPWVKQQMIDWLGHSVYEDDGSINREELAEIIFNDETALERVMDLIRGPLASRFHEECYAWKYRCGEAPPFILYESAVLMERSLYSQFDMVFIVDADKKIREERVSERSGLTGDKFDERDKKQNRTEEITRILTKAMIPYRVIENHGQDLVPLLKSIAITHGWNENENLNNK